MVLTEADFAAKSANQESKDYGIAMESTAITAWPNKKANLDECNGFNNREAQAPGARFIAGGTTRG